ncbi:MAG: response regulator [Nitrospiraceae bacterium]|nr:MAG: response regulator [Nitrospiraceae bacterium]
MVTVLVVNDEINVLNSIERLFIDSGIRLLRAENALTALDIVSNENVAVVVSDHQMPGMKGIDLLSRIKDISPDTFKILMIANTDLEKAVEAVNTGDVFRFIIKPWQNDSIIKAVNEAIEQFALVQALKSSDENTLLSLAEAVELKDGYTRGHCERVADYALITASELNLQDAIKTDIRHGSWIHDCGKIGIPESILKKKGTLDADEFEIMKNHPQWGVDIAKKAAMSHAVINIINYHHERYDGSGYPAGLSSDEIPIEARIVTIADVYDALTTERPYRDKYSNEKATEIMSIMRGSVFDPDILDIFLDVYATVTK